MVIETGRHQRKRFLRPRFRASGFEAPYTEAQGARAEGVSGVDLLPAHLLDGGEVVILAIKPSLWFIVFQSARWLVAMVLLILLAGWLGRLVPSIETGMIVRAALALGGARVGFAMLQWASRLYVLTNRRVMRLQGIFNVDVFECLLTKIQNTFLTLAWYERLTGLGSIAFVTAGTGGVEARWLHVNSPLELHERLRSAIHRAQRPGNGV